MKFAIRYETTDLALQMYPSMKDCNAGFVASYASSSYISPTAWYLYRCVKQLSYGYEASSFHADPDHLFLCGDPWQLHKVVPSLQILQKEAFWFEGDYLKEMQNVQQKFDSFNQLYTWFAVNENDELIHILQHEHPDHYFLHAAYFQYAKLHNNTPQNAQCICSKQTIFTQGCKCGSLKKKHT